MLLSITWNIDPEIFSLGPIHVRYYGVLFALAFVCDYLIFVRFFKREKLPLPLLDTLTMWAVIFTIVGLRLGHCLFYEPAHYLAHPFDMLKIWEGGLASHGAAVALPLGLFLFCRKYKMSYLWLLDRIVIVVALTGFFIRIGNLMNSEIYGVQTSLPWGFIFERRHEIMPKHPTQIYEALAYLLIFFILLHIFVKKDNLRRRGGFLFGAFLTLLFTFRFLVEFIKERQVDFEEGMLLDMGQLLSIPFVLAGVCLLIYSLRCAPQSKPFIGNVNPFEDKAKEKQGAPRSKSGDRVKK